MSNFIAAPDSFWREFKSDVAGTLSQEQRGEIERVLEKSSGAGANKISDLRLSFKWFFVRIAWGPEKRSAERIQQEQETHPPLALNNVPMLASLYVGFVALLFLAMVACIYLFYYLSI